ncbi:hypothetical protein GCM10025795_54440 [Verticiella sediminum]
MDLEVLRKAPLFTNLDDEVFSALTSELTEVELSRGTSAFHEGDQGDPPRQPAASADEDPVHDLVGPTGVGEQLAEHRAERDQ